MLIVALIALAIAVILLVRSNLAQRATIVNVKTYASSLEDTVFQNEADLVLVLDASKEAAVLRDIDRRRDEVVIKDLRWELNAAHMMLAHTIKEVMTLETSVVVEVPKDELAEARDRAQINVTQYFGTKSAP